MNQPSETGPIDNRQFITDYWSKLGFPHGRFTLTLEDYCELYNLTDEEKVVAALRWN